LLLPFVIAAEGLVDLLGQFAGGFFPGIFESFPKMGVVDVPTGIVANGGADLGRQGVEALEELLGGLFLKIGIRGHGFVEVVDVGGVVFAVVEGHGFGVDVGLEGIGWVGKRRKGEGTGGNRRRLRRRGGREQARGESSSEEGLEEGAAGHGSMFKPFGKVGSFSFTFTVTFRI